MLNFGAFIQEINCRQKKEKKTSQPRVSRFSLTVINMEGNTNL